MAKKSFMDVLANTKTEEEVKAAYKEQFGINGIMRNAVDLRTENVLFEFKNRKSFVAVKGRENRAKTLAQALYYVRRCKFGGSKYAIPNQIVIAEQSSAVIYITKEWIDIYSDDSYDWNRKPSSPCPELVEAVTDHAEDLDTTCDEFTMSETEQLKLFSDKLDNHINAANNPTDFKVVSIDNFEDVFEHWKSVIGKFITKVDNIAAYFMRDLQYKPSYDDEKGLLTFNFRGIPEEFSIPPKVYRNFWKIYRRPPTAAAMESVITKADRLNNMDKRRFNGEFYTPLEFAKKGLDYIAKELGDDWYNEYKIWDMACGTGNLEYHIPNYKNVYMSSLDDDEIMHMQNANIFPDATIFQYDYLNDDVDLVMSDLEDDLLSDDDYCALLDDSLGWKLPRQLREDLANPNNKWVVLMNPPFAAGAGKTHGEVERKGMSETKIKKHLDIEDAKQELSTQFVCRIKRELPNAVLAMFAPLKYVCAPNHEKFRNEVFNVEFKKGFIFPCATFQSLEKKKWPVSFLIWDLGTTNDLINQYIKVDVLNGEKSNNEVFDCNHIGDKVISIILKEKGLGKLINKPKLRSIIVPPLKSAITQTTGEIKCDKGTTSAIGYHRFKGNDFQTQNQLFLTSAPYGGGHVHAITPTIFNESMIVNTVRKIIAISWTNNRDQFALPNKPLTTEFKNDCVIWSLFNGSNQSSSLKDVEYKGNTYQIKNEFYPFTIEQVKKWETRNILRKETDRFVANWIQDNKQSAEAKKVLTIAKQIYALYYSEYANLNVPKFKLGNWDAGWYQIRHALKDADLGNDLLERFNTVYSKLTAKLKPSVYEYGFLDRETMFE